MARPKDRKYPLKVPYELMIKTCAYADLPYVRAIKLLRSYGYLVPVIDDDLKSRYKEYRKEAKDIDENLEISPRLISSLGLDPLYSWIKAVGDPLRNDKTRLMTRILDEMTHPLLRRSVDVLLFVKKTPEEIAEILSQQCDSPVPQWGPDDIEVYRKFFWDTSRMNLRDWSVYGTWCLKSMEEYEFDYVFLFPTSSTADLLWEAGVTPELPQSQISDLMLHECFVRFKKKLEDDDEAGALRFMGAYRQLLDVVKKGAGQATGSSLKRRSDKLNEALDRVEVLFRDDKCPPTASREDLGRDGRRVEVSPKDSVTINPAAIDTKPSESEDLGD